MRKLVCNVTEVLTLSFVFVVEIECVDFLLHIFCLYLNIMKMSPWNKYLLVGALITITTDWKIVF